MGRERGGGGTYRRPPPSRRLRGGAPRSRSLLAVPPRGRDARRPVRGAPRRPAAAASRTRHRRAGRGRRRMEGGSGGAPSPRVGRRRSAPRPPAGPPVPAPEFRWSLQHPASGGAPRTAPGSTRTGNRRGARSPPVGAGNASGPWIRATAAGMPTGPPASSGTAAAPAQGRRTGGPHPRGAGRGRRRARPPPTRNARPGSGASPSRSPRPAGRTCRDSWKTAAAEGGPGRAGGRVLRCGAPALPGCGGRRAGPGTGGQFCTGMPSSSPNGPARRVSSSTSAAGAGKTATSS